jgi:hypothetical protein
LFSGGPRHFASHTAMRRNWVTKSVGGVGFEAAQLGLQGDGN